ncbi:hypothetical protein [Paludibaculum fermentans]|uniref:Uncharacterized protein n=1 Tax=Paludibaculum fermentans TaxID=1473598 RepID=A0A7S7NKR5_PALFE|nr:hypothetical protein [Paludibaculum fermentans]QOY85354.1 hypothetical protein IRI77_21265 [Paludibaculum fermentans]
MDGLNRDEPEEILAGHLDRLESILAQKDTEVRRLRTELDLRQLYVNELHAALNRQTRQLQDLDKRIRLLEARRPHAIAELVPDPPAPPPSWTARIRIKKAF